MIEKMDDRTIQRDRMRFIKNSLSSTLAIVGILFDVFYFVNLYQSDVGTYYYNYMIGVSIIYYAMQAFNRYMLVCSIVQILLACLLFLTNTHSRRRYYIGNFAATAAFVAGAVYSSICCHIRIEEAKAQFLQVDFAALKEHAEMWGTLYTESTFWFDVHYLVFGLLLVVSALLVANAVWKVNLMKDEAALVAEGRRNAG